MGNINFQLKGEEVKSHEEDKRGAFRLGRGAARGPSKQQHCRGVSVLPVRELKEWDFRPGNRNLKRLSNPAGTTSPSSDNRGKKGSENEEITCQEREFSKSYRSLFLGCAQGRRRVHPQERRRVRGVSACLGHRPGRRRECRRLAVPRPI